MTEQLKPLKPITAKEQEAFDRRRETASVVQNKCTNCGEWYETAKRSTVFQEVFRCDCGEPMSFTVPAMEIPRMKIGELDLDDVLDTGMKVRQAIASACHWWGRSGRHQMRKDGPKGSALAVSLDPESPNYIPSGILNGEQWDHLNDREKAQVVKAWHHHYVRKPQTEKGE